MLTKQQIDRNKPKIKLPGGKKYINIKNIVHKHHLNTICESGHCPNLSECWGNGMATFMILGNICTRACKFCSVPTGKPFPPDKKEPYRIAKSIQLMGLSHCVITSVDRDDLPDFGSGFWTETVLQVRKLNPNITLEILIPDFNFNKSALDKIIAVRPEIVSHNLETVKRLTPKIRSKAQYDRSLDVLYYLNKKGIVTKSGIMLGMGETVAEIDQVMDDLLSVGCKIITIGQYLQPSSENLPVTRFIPPEEFDRHRTVAKEKGFNFVESGPLVRSSYHAEKHIRKIFI